MELTKEILREHSKANALAIGHAIYTDPNLLEEALQLLLSKKENVANRAAYAISQAHDLELSRKTNKFGPFYSFLIEHLEQYEHQGIRRNICRMLAGCDLKTLEKLDLGTVADITIMWLYDSKKSIATKAHSMAILLKICKIEPDFSSEVKMAITECSNRFPSKGIVSRSKRILSALNKL